MGYVALRTRKLAGERYTAGDTIPDDVIQSLSADKVRILEDNGRIRQTVEVDDISEPTYKGRWWWEWPNGLKVRSPKDSPMNVLRAKFEAEHGEA